jgi:transposase
VRLIPFFIIPVGGLTMFVLGVVMIVDAITTAVLDYDGKSDGRRIQRVHARVAREVGRPVEIISCYEAGYDGFWLHRLLESQGVHSLVVDPASVQEDRRARRTKTDRIDVERLLRSLMAYLRGERKVSSVVRDRVSPKKMTIGCTMNVIG